MVAVMRSSSGKGKVKFEVVDEDPVEAGEHQQLSPPPHKRTKLFPGLERDGGIGEVVTEEYHPLKEPSPLGLRLKKSPSFLELVRMTLSQENSSNHKGSSAHAAADKLKASNFPASVLKIGTWEYKSRYEGDVVAKCYFAKHKLVWEVLDGALKNKIEIQWSDVVAIKANHGVEGMDTLDVVLARQPLFFRETNPQPRKHTLWQPTSDFTGGQASIYRCPLLRTGSSVPGNKVTGNRALIWDLLVSLNRLHHFLQCQQGLLGRHFEKLVQCDPRLNFLSQQQKFVLDSLHFESKDPSFGDHGVSLLGPELNKEKSSFLLSLSDEVASPSGSLCNNLNKKEYFPRTAPDDYTRKAASPRSVMDTRAIEDIEHSGLRRCPPIKAPDVASSMPISNMVVHISHCMSEQATPSIPFLPSEEASERDVPVGKTRPIRKRHQLLDTSRASTGVKNNSGREKGQGMRRKDSVGELLVNLPRISSLPHILPNADEDACQYRQNRW